LDILVEEVQFDGKNPLDWQNFKEALICFCRNVNQKMVGRNKFDLLLKNYANEFQHVCFPIIKFSIFTSDKIEQFFARFKEDVRNKVLIDSNEDGGP